MEGETNKSEVAAMGGSRSVFLSYASHDADTANSVCQFLESHGVSCWLAPRDVKPGAQYADAIVRAINEAEALVLVLSASAVGSDHVAREVERAASKHKAIIAFRIDGVALNPGLEYFLSNSQWIDVAALGMPAALAKLQGAVGQGAAQTEVSDADFPGRRKRRRLAVVAAAGLGVGVAVALGVHFLAIKPGAQAPAGVAAAPGANSPSTVPISDKSIAVLPFVDMSEKKDQEYFADGIAEEILDLLAKVPGLTVIGRTSSFHFKGANEDLRSIGATLNAAYILEGSVRKSGDQLRITAQLINTKTGTHEWSETYDRHVDDVLKLQDAIALAVVRELQLTVAPDYLQKRSAVKNAEAYDLLLRGRHAGDRLDREGLDEAATLFQRALDLDPTSVDAAASLAWTFDAQGEWGMRPPAQAFEQARQAAAVALKLDPKNVLGHFVLARIHIVYDWDWVVAAREFEQVAGLAAGKGDALDSEALLPLALGRWDDALRKINAALAQDPLDPPSLFILTEIQTRRRHYPEAEAAMRRALNIRPTQAFAHFTLGLVMLALDNPNGALLEMQEETSEFGQLEGLAIANYALHRVAESDAALSRMLKEQETGNALGIAEVYAFRGQLDDAMQWIDRAFIQKDVGLYAIKGDPPLKNLESDQRFKAFLQKMNLPVRDDVAD